jgi:hypothetical protein
MPKAKKVVAVEIYLQKRKTREYVGNLTNEGSEFVFIYDDKYIYGRKSIQIGPDLPLSKIRHASKRLFDTFEDRIPSKKNPAYKDYCKAMGISPDEKDQLTLVGTLGSRGPSSFVFVPKYLEEIKKDDVILLRKQLGLSIREFADVFDFAPATIYRIESGKSSGKDALKRLEIYLKFPETALYEIDKNGGRISDEKKNNARESLEKKLKESVS